jgi:dipeptidyl aminopeptidase/acylaminoacyl peptidase
MLWARETVEPRNGIYYFEMSIRDAKSGNFSVHDALTTDSSKRNSVYIVGRDEATGKFYITTDKFRDLAAIYLYDPDSRTFDETPVFAHERFAADGVILGRTEEDFNDVLGYSYFAETPQVEWIDPYFKSIQALFEAEFPGQYVAIEDYTNNKRKVVVSVQDGSASLAFYMVVDGAEIIKIGEASPWIDPADVGRTELIYYQARDGLSIPALLTRPAGWKKGDKPSPAIVLPHGGPWSRDILGWDDSGWIPFFTSRGYAVLQPQYRGSEGWGNNLWRAGDAEWGLKMQDDKDDGAKWMVDQGIAAPGEISIFGYSYGGFAAFAAAVRPDGPFRCAIAGAGVADLEKLGYTWSENRLQRIYQGKTVRGMDPQKNTDNINIPILMFSGDRDVRVPRWHSENFYRKIEGRVPAELVLIRDMPHQFPWRRVWKQQILEATERFMKAHCGMN